MCTRQWLPKQTVCVCVWREKERKWAWHTYQKQNQSPGSLFIILCSLFIYKTKRIFKWKLIFQFDKSRPLLNHNCHCKTLLVHFNWPSAKHFFRYFEMSSISHTLSLSFTISELWIWTMAQGFWFGAYFENQKMLSITNMMSVLNSQAVNFLLVLIHS